MSSGVRDLAELWQRFENWLAEHAPGDYASLRPGASQEDIERLEDRALIAIQPAPENSTAQTEAFARQLRQRAKPPPAPR